MEIAIKSSQVRNIALRAAKAKRPLFIWGPPGIGKSELVQGLVDSGDLSGPADENGNRKGAALIDLRLALMEPTDLRGFPFRNPETNQMEWAQMGDLPSQEFADKYHTVVLFLDELNSAPPSVQAAAYQLVLNRRIGAYELPSNVVIFAAGNRENDRGVVYRMPAPLANRFRHVTMAVDFGDWMRWAIMNEVHPDVIGYLSYAKQDLFDFDPKHTGAAFATPRSWNYVSEMLYTDGFDTADISEQKAEVAGAVGDGTSAKFIEHRRVSAKLPRPEDILSGKVKQLDASMKTEISAKYSLVVGLSYEINQYYKVHNTGGEFKKQFNNAVRFAYDNFEPEMVVLFFKTIMSDYKIQFNIRTDLDTELYKIFADKYTKYLVG